MPFPQPAPFLQQGIDQPWPGSSVLGRVVLGSAFPPVPTQLVGWPEFFQSLLNYLVSQNVFGPGSLAFAVDPDSDIKWPAGPGPFGLIVPGRMTNGPTYDGGGRMVKTWEVEITIHIVINTQYDVAWQDTAAVTSASLVFGPYALIQLLIDRFEQALFTTPSGNYAVVELPRSTRIDELYRFKNSVTYTSIPVVFEMMIEERLPSTWWPTALVPDTADVDTWANA